MNTVADEITLGRKYGRQSDVALRVLIFSVASVLLLAAVDKIIPHRDAPQHSSRNADDLGAPVVVREKPQV